MLRQFGIRSLLAASALAAVTLLAGCGGGYGYGYSSGYRVYDPYYRDYHVWGQPEIGYYNTWLGETHRPYREFREMPRRDRDDYWRWRHAPGREGGEHHDRH